MIALDQYGAGGVVRIELRKDAGRIGPTTGPWIRRNQIARFLGTPDPHALAQVIDRHGEGLGWGLVSPASTITVRLLSFGPDRPTDDWLEQRLGQAWAARDCFGFEAAKTTGYRLVNSEGDGLPGLVIDRYGADLVIQLGTAPMAAREAQLLSWLRVHWQGPIHVVVPESSARHEGMPHGVRVDGTEELLRFSEYGVLFAAPAPPGQKTGAYFDQRVNRRIVASLARRNGGAMLDLGCHVGGFALHARHTGVDVVALDQSARALEVARRNATDNGLEGIQWVQGDMFAALDDPRLAGPFGTIVFDPPKLAGRKADVDRARQAMERVVTRLMPRLSSGGHLVLCSCSHHLGREHLDRVVAASSLTRVMALGAGPDHPLWPCHREGEYLRVNVYQARFGA